MGMTQCMCDLLTTQLTESWNQWVNKAFSEWETALVNAALRDSMSQLVPDCITQGASGSLWAGVTMWLRDKTRGWVALWASEMERACMIE